MANLAGVPSVVFGLLGLTVFVRLFEMGRSILAGGLTMSLLILTRHRSRLKRSYPVYPAGTVRSRLCHGSDQMADHSKRSCFQPPHPES
ncbi:MAG: hypothetical protein U5K84_13705 [Alkalibacterium sp.]|nr:hypothetical protein [Alkalibacterium sp.]